MSDTSEQTFRKMQDMVKELKKHEPTIKKAYEGVTKDLRKAIDDGSEDEIRITQPDLAPAIDKIDQGLDACDRMHVMTTALMTDKAFIASHLKEFKDIIGHLAVTKKQMSAWATAARDLGKEADRALGIAQKDTKEMEAELAGLKNRASKLRNSLRALKASAPTLEKAARDATAKHDEKSAERSRLALFDLMKDPKRYLQEMRPLLDKFEKDHPDLDKDRQAELDDVERAFGEGDTAVKIGDKTFADLIKLKQTTMAAAKPAAPPPVPKAELDAVANILGMDAKDSKNHSTLVRILNGSPHKLWEKQLGDLARTLKSKKTGKMIMQDIEKRPYFKKQQAQLIDI